MSLVNSDRMLAIKSFKFYFLDNLKDMKPKYNLIKMKEASEDTVSQEEFYLIPSKNKFDTIYKEIN